MAEFNIGLRPIDRRLDADGRRATRLDLANGLTEADKSAGGMTARVMVNRFWYLLFGRGLAAVIDDFGGEGKLPDHPELLDALAIELIESGWNMKHLMKQILLSATHEHLSRFRGPISVSTMQ
jgi:hypothetical protein